MRVQLLQNTLPATKQNTHSLKRHKSEPAGQIENDRRVFIIKAVAFTDFYDESNCIFVY